MKKATWLLAPLVVAALAGCGSTSHTSSPTTASTTSPATSATSNSTAPSSGSTSMPTGTTQTTTTGPAVTSSPSVTAAPTTVVRQCSTSELTASLSGANGAAGTIYYQLTFTNHGTVECVTQGYPGVSFVTGTSGTQVGAPARRETGPAPLIYLQPGQAASATLGIVDAANYGSTCGITPVLGLRVYPPNETAALFVPHTDQGCANSADVTLTIRPLVAS